MPIQRISQLIFSTCLLFPLSVAAAPACHTPVESYSNRTQMAAGDFSANVQWQDLNLTSTSIGYGASAGREYELTILDGTVYRVNPTGDGINSEQGKPAEGGATMLQVSSPKQWQAYDTPLDAISSFDDLSFALDELLEELGCGDNALLPFKISGHANHLRWSLDTLPKPLVTDSTQQAVTLVGVYNRSAKKRYFMVPGYSIHTHAVLHDSNYAGHVRDIDLKAGAQLWLPSLGD